jgi:hypothetical protein
MYEDYHQQWHIQQNYPTGNEPPHLPGPNMEHYGVSSSQHEFNHQQQWHIQQNGPAGYVDPRPPVMYDGYHQGPYYTVNDDHQSPPSSPYDDLLSIYVNSSNPGSSYAPSAQQAASLSNGTAPSREITTDGEVADLIIELGG